MTVQQTIEGKLTAALAPLHLDVVNESHMHNVPAGSESHFKVIVVSAGFDGEPLIRRHRRVNEILADELASAVHALALHTMTEAEWRRRAGAAMSPACHGGDRIEK